MKRAKNAAIFNNSVSILKADYFGPVELQLPHKFIRLKVSAQW
jgi:hypothetical protein